MFILWSALGSMLLICDGCLPRTYERLFIFLESVAAGMALGVLLVLILSGELFRTTTRAIAGIETRLGTNRARDGSRNAPRACSF
jgi:hypothetical protein